MSKSTSKFKRRDVELLAPAGSEKSFVAAVENGADAVYVGGQEFNARMHAGNFSRDSLRDAVRYAHLHGADVHVTMNTLLTQEELKPAFRYAEFLYEIGVDAIIIQDMGLVGMLREFIPDFPLHMSTQCTAQDLDTVRAAEKLGFSRVVLSRELSYGEIRAISQKTDMELECFIHGAQCVCYSGQCQMSRYFGGRSGNRGTCAQPCRLKYRTFDEEGREIIDAGEHPLSPKDLCLLEDVGSLIDLGVRSFKIEGRMKSPEYVAVVVGLYRKYMNQHLAGKKIRVTPEDREQLAQIFNRGGFTKGYFHGYPGKDLIAADVPKHQGIYVGEVVSRPKRSQNQEKQGEKRKFRGDGSLEFSGETLVDLKLEKSLQVGDGIEIHGPKLTGNVISYLKPMGKITRVGDIKGIVEKGNAVYRISSKAQLDQARKSFEHITFTEGKTARRIPVKYRINSAYDGTFSIRGEAAGQKVVVSAGPFEYDMDSEATQARMQESLRKTGDTSFICEDIRFYGDTYFSIKKSEINALRRQLLEELTEKIGAPRRYTPAEESQVDSYLDFPLSMESTQEAVYYRWDDWTKDPRRNDLLARGCTVLLPAAEVLGHEQELADVRWMPYTSSVVKGMESALLEEHFEQVCDMARERGVYAGTLGWALRFLEAGVPVYGDAGLNAYNEGAWKTFGGMGILPGAYSLETLEEENGAYPLMVSQYHPQGVQLKGKGQVRILEKDTSSQIILLPEGSVWYYLRNSLRK